MPRRMRRTIVLAPATDLRSFTPAPPPISPGTASFTRRSRSTRPSIWRPPPSPGPPDDGGSPPSFLTAAEVLSLALRADLVTLSSCANGAQSVGPGDEPVGFPRALIYAGAASVLASLWPVNTFRPASSWTASIARSGKGSTRPKRCNRLSCTFSV